MPKYTVFVDKIETHSIEVIAKDISDAMDKALRKVDRKPDKSAMKHTSADCQWTFCENCIHCENHCKECKLQIKELKRLTKEQKARDKK